MQSLFESFRTTADRIPGNPAIIQQGPDRDTSVSYAELAGLADCAAVFLTRQGIVPGDRCALLAENHIRWCAAYLGILRIGGIAVPLDTMLSASQIGTLLRDSGSRLLLTSHRQLDKARAAARVCPQLTHTGLLGTREGPVPRGARESAVFCDDTAPDFALDACRCRREDVAVILYTSGTTSDPKGVMLTHGNLLSGIEGAVRPFSITEGDQSLGVLPLFHILAQVASLLAPFYVGASVVLLEEPDSGQILRAFRNQKISVFCCVPQFYYLLRERIVAQVAGSHRVKRMLFWCLFRLNGVSRKILRLNLGPVFFRRVHDLFGPKMRLLVTGGARFDGRVWRDFRCLGLDLVQAYGLTETAGPVTITPPGEYVPDSVGKPIPGVKVEIVDSGQGPAASPVGEIAVRGPTVMKGYYNRPDATEAALSNGVLRTGDLGYFDSRQHLHIAGRIKEVIVLSSGKNIYPEEIEMHYSQSPLIAEVAVFGERDDAGPTSQQRLHALVVPDMHMAKQRGIVNVGEAVRYEIEVLSVQLPPSKRISGYELRMEPLPRTTTRKLQRNKIERGLPTAPAADRVRDWTAEHETWLDQADVPELLGAIRAVLPGRDRRLHPDDILELDLGLDSLARLELLVAVARQAGVRLGEEAAGKVYTVRDLVEALRAARGASGEQPERDPEASVWSDVLAAPLHPGVGPDPLQQSLVWSLIAYVLLRVVHVAAQILLRLDVTGRENIPGEGPYILCCNHQSYLDGFLLASVLPWRVFRRLVLLGDPRFVSGSVIGAAARRVGIVPIDRDVNVRRAMQISAAGLRRGRVLMVFPEGELSYDGTMRPFRRGTAILACHLNVPLVPVALDGTFEVWPRKKTPQRLAKVRIRIGTPLAAPEAPHDERAENRTAETYERICAELEDRVHSLLFAAKP